MQNNKLLMLSLSGMLSDKYLKEFLFDYDIKFQTFHMILYSDDNSLDFDLLEKTVDNKRMGDDSVLKFFYNKARNIFNIDELYSCAMNNCMTEYEQKIHYYIKNTVNKMPNNFDREYYCEITSSNYTIEDSVTIHSMYMSSVYIEIYYNKYEDNIKMQFYFDRELCFKAESLDDMKKFDHYLQASTGLADIFKKMIHSLDQDKLKQIIDIIVDSYKDEEE